MSSPRQTRGKEQQNENLYDRRNQQHQRVGFPEAGGRGASNAERFGSQSELAELAGTWAPGRIVDIWNSLPGVSPVKKFTDRKTAIARIWKAIQSLDGGAQSADVAPEAVETDKDSTPPKKGTRAKKVAKSAKPARKPKATVREAREGRQTAE